MTKNKFLTIFAIIIICLFSTTLIAQENSSKTSKSIPSLEVSFEKKAVVKWCQYVKDENNPCPKDEQNTKVYVKPQNLKKNLKLKYTYVVSGGQIIEDGANIIWDFSNDLRPGRYTLKIIADGNKNFHLESEIKTIVVEQCGHGCGIFDPVCECPTLAAKSPTLSVKAGETITFNAIVTGGSQKSVGYNWTISRRPIIEGQSTKLIHLSGATIEGQSTPTIKVKTTSEMAGETILATVEIGGLCPDCGRTASVAVEVEKP